MLTLQPQKSFTVVRQLNNPYITDTFYVRAVIRNAYTDSIIDTLDLDDKGNQRFKKDWQVVPDSSGEGFYISIITSCYTDAGYTVKSENYGDEENTYLVANRLNTSHGGGGLDSFTVRQIIREELKKEYDKEEEKEEGEEEEETLNGEVFLCLNEIKDMCKKMCDKPEKEETPIDLSPIIKDIKDIKKIVNKKDLISSLDSVKEIIIEGYKKSSDSMEDKHDKVIETLSFVDRLPYLIAHSTMRAIKLYKEDDESELTELDLNKIAI